MPERTASYANVCQQWSIRNRMQINTEKKNDGFLQNPPLLRAWKEPAWPKKSVSW